MSIKMLSECLQVLILRIVLMLHFEPPSTRNFVQNQMQSFNQKPGFNVYSFAQTTSRIQHRVSFTEWSQLREFVGMFFETFLGNDSLKSFFHHHHNKRSNGHLVSSLPRLVKQLWSGVGKNWQRH